MSTFKLANSYLSSGIYNSIIDKNHFLCCLDALFDWDDLALPLWDLAKNEHGGRPRNNPVVLLKMIFLGFLFDTSDMDTEFYSTTNLYCKYFLRLPIDEKAPDASCLSRFRNDVLEARGSSFFVSLFNKILTQAQDRGIVFGKIHAIDSTHTIANTNTFNDSKNQDSEIKPRDPDASWGTKKIETRKTVDGKKVEVPVHFHGYKAHLVGETDHGLITGLHSTSGAAADIDGWDVLIHRVLSEEQRKAIDVLLADKAGGCPVWINLLEKYDHILTAFSLPENMLTKGEHKEKWQAYKNDEGRNAFKKKRYVIERINADLKNNHSLRRCRYLGKTKYHLQTTMAAIAHNIKFMVRIMTGVRFRAI